MILRRFFTPGLAINTYLLYDEEIRQGVVIDPTRQIEAYLSCALQENIDITDIIETHVHADFVSGAQKLKAALSQRPMIHCSGMGGAQWIPSYADHIVSDGDQLQLGHVRLEAKHTPGHTPEHLMWLFFDENRSQTVPVGAFTGDLLFVGSVGRPDLLGPEAEQELVQQLYRTLFGTLHTLPEFLEIYPAHGAGSACGKQIGARETSTLGYERRCNPWLMPKDFKSWVEQLFKDFPAIPSYFSRMKRLNISGIEKHSSSSEIPPSVTKKDVESLKKTCWIVDIRSPENFASGHLENSINIPLTPNFPAWAGAILPGDQELLIVSDRPSSAISAVQALQLIGSEFLVRGIVDISLWKGEENLLSKLPRKQIYQLQNDYQNTFILDVRMPLEWNAGHIPGAHHIELNAIPRSLEKLPKNIPIAVVCHSGNRSSMTASLLLKENFQAFDIRGGMHAWQKAGLPLSHSM